MTDSCIVQVKFLQAPHHILLKAQASNYYKGYQQGELSSKIILCASYSRNTEAMRGQVVAVMCGGETKSECARAVLPKNTDTKTRFLRMNFAGTQQEM